MIGMIFAETSYVGRGRINQPRGSCRIRDFRRTSTRSRHRYVSARSAVGTAIGFGGIGGAVSGMLVAPAIGYWLDFSHNAYAPLFFIFGSMYLVALGVIQLMAPRLEPVAL